MTQRKSSEDRAQARAIGRRLRNLRGEASQLDFAAHFGLTRSALANYELGRSRPPKELLERIKDHTGIDLDTGPEPQDFEADLKALVGDGTNLTEDEWAMVRILRVALPEDIRTVAEVLVKSIEDRGAGLQLADPKTVALDLARLYAVTLGQRDYARGISGASVVQLARVLAGFEKG